MSECSQMSWVQSKGFQIFSKASFILSSSSSVQVCVVLTLCISMLSAVAMTSQQNSRFHARSFSITCAKPSPFTKSTKKYFICLGICACSPPFSRLMRMMLACVPQLPSTSSSACLKKKGRSSARARGIARHSVQMWVLSRENCSKKTGCRSYLSNAWMRHLRQLLSSVRVSALRPMAVCSWSTGASTRWNSPSNVRVRGSARQAQLEALTSTASSLSGQNGQYSCTRLDAMIGRLRFLISRFTRSRSPSPSKLMLYSNFPRDGADGPAGTSFWRTRSSSYSNCSTRPLRKSCRQTSSASFVCRSYSRWKTSTALGCSCSSAIWLALMEDSSTAERTRLATSSSAAPAFDFFKPFSISFSLYPIQIRERE